MMPESAAAQPGREAKYQPIAELGRGGMATVVLAVVKGPAGFNKLQVLKRLRPALAADPDFLRMFLDEARLAARINHPNVVQTNEVGFDGQFYFIAMEYLDGQTLETVSRKVTKTGNPLPLPMQLHTLAETLAGLHFAHELADFDGTPLNVVHRDVSPHNVMVGYDGHVKILDFGIAKAADSTSDTRTGIMKGKCAYMAPEQFGGAVDRRADVFAVGVMLWQVLTGTRMWKGLSDSQIFARLACGDIPLPSTVKPVPVELERICMRALEKKAEDRFPTAADFQTELENYITRAALHVTPRELGKHLSDLFAESRAAIRTAIEAQLSKPRPTSDVAFSTDVPDLSLLVPSSSSEVRAATGTGMEGVERVSRTLASPDFRRRFSRVPLVLGAGVIVAGLGVFALTRQSETQAPPAPVASAMASAAIAPPALVHLTIRATPADAHLFLDDGPLEGNPATRTAPKDGATHHVRAEATGYVTKHDVVVFDTGSMNVELALDREKPAAVAQARGGPVGRAAMAPPAPSPTPEITLAPPPQSAAPPLAPVPAPKSTKPDLVLDTGNPWAK